MSVLLLNMSSLVIPDKKANKCSLFKYRILGDISALSFKSFWYVSYSENYMCKKYIEMCWWDDKMKPNTNMTWDHKYLNCISSLGNILYPNIFQELNVDTHKERERHSARASTTRQYKNVPWTMETQWTCSLL